MSKRKITDFFSQNKITKTSEPQHSHHDTIDTDLDELPTPTYTKKSKEKRFYNKKWENDFLINTTKLQCFRLKLFLCFLLSLNNLVPFPFEIYFFVQNYHHT